MFYKTILLSILFLAFPDGNNKNIFVAPLDIPISLSANFGELRPGHFHSGIDIKTNGVTGKKVYSVADGYIYRISVSPTGFGNALYIRHNNGYSSVYAHLDRFIPTIEEYVTSEQYKEQSHSINLYPAKKQFVIKQGEQIAFSGNSGSSGGPHLHFEIRRSDNEHPVNPQDFFNISDDINPVIDKLVIYPLNTASAVEGRNDKSYYSLIGSKGEYRLKSNKLIPVSGEIGIGLSTFDYISGSWNKCGVRTIEVIKDSSLVYTHSIDEFSFKNTRYLNSHIDFREYYNNSNYVQKTFLEANNELGIYGNMINRGRIFAGDSSVHDIKVNVYDFSGNCSRLCFSLIGSDAKCDIDTNSPVSSEPSVIFPYASENSFELTDIKLSFPPKSFYDTIKFTYHKTAGIKTTIADVHHIHHPEVPVHNWYTISVRPYACDSSIISKAGLVIIRNNKLSFIGGNYIDGYFTARVREFGDFSIAADSLAPEIKALNFSDGMNLQNFSEIRIKLSDNFSGICDYYAEIDNKWALFEYDPKTQVLSFYFRKSKLEVNKKHNLIIYASDACNNQAVLKLNFFR